MGFIKCIRCGMIETYRMSVMCENGMDHLCRQCGTGYWNTPLSDLAVLVKECSLQSISSVSKSTENDSSI